MEALRELLGPENVHLRCAPPQMPARNGPPYNRGGVPRTTPA